VETVRGERNRRAAISLLVWPAAFAAVLDGPLEGFAALGEPVEVGDGDAGAGDTGGADVLAEAGDRGVGAAAEEADHDQGVERLDEDLVVRVAGIVKFVDGGDQQPVGDLDVAVAVQQVVGARHGGRERTAGAGVGAAGLLKQAGGVAQVAGDDRAQVGGLGQPSAPPTESPRRRLAWATS
jgi:hypothetical protein